MFYNDLVYTYSLVVWYDKALHSRVILCFTKCFNVLMGGSLREEALSVLGQLPRPRLPGVPPAPPPTPRAPSVACVIVDVGPSHHLEAGLLWWRHTWWETVTAFLWALLRDSGAGGGVTWRGQVNGDPACASSLQMFSWFLGAFGIFASFSSCSFHCSSYSVSKL